MEPSPLWMDFVPFRPFFHEIAQEFGFNSEKEILARDFFHRNLSSTDPKALITRISETVKNRVVCFFGAGANLIAHLKKLSPILKEKRQHFFLVTADGSSNALMENNIIPDMVVSDFDGLTVSQMKSLAENRVILCLLAHGDNYQLIDDYLSILKPEFSVIGTTQAPAHYPIINPGGFTDGDRGVFLLHHLVPLDKPFFLFGYDFEGKIGSYSKPSYLQDMPLNPVKRKKLQICRRLLALISKKWHRTIRLFDEIATMHEFEKQLIK